MYNLFCICASRVSRKGRGVFPCLVAILLFASCQSYKKVPYLQDAKVVEQTAQQENLYDAKIMPKDLLTIVEIGRASCSVMYQPGIGCSV